MNRILILGATGNLGGLTAAALTANYPNATVRLASSRAAGCATLRERFPQAEAVQADWYDVDSLKRAAAGADRVFVITPDFATDETVVTPNIIAAVRAAGGIKQIVRLIAIPPGLTAADLAQAELATQCGAAMHTVAKPLLDASGLPITYLNVPCWIMFNLPWFLAEDIKTRRRLAMPAKSDSARRWVSENDIAAVAAKLLTDPVAEHIGKEYRLTGAQRYTYAELAALLSEVLGERVAYADEDSTLRRVMGDNFNTLMTYFEHETRDYAGVQPTDTVSRLLGRPQVTLGDYVVANRDLFI
jgi:NAD(P)H dehydrogenase (quinone)